MVPIAQALRAGAARLEAAGIENARREARRILAHALGMQPAELLFQPQAPVPTDAFDALLARRAAREPLALITGHQEFWSLDFAVSPDTLVPRPDSETLIEAALAAFPARDGVGRVLDLGTGTGCLLLAALHEFPVAFGIGVDRIPVAAALARRNAAALGLAGRTAFLCGDWASALAGRFDLVLCNPPYIPAAEIASLMPEVALHEPGSALSGGADGLDAYRAVIATLPGLLAPDGAAILELGQGQAPAVAALAGAWNFATALRFDLSGIARALVIRPRR
jgi:release factor glutamine methyltransferase